MSNDFWKQFEGAEPIDCLKMKHDIQAKIYEETKDMNWEERFAYMRTKREVHPASSELAARETPPEYGASQS